MQATLALSFARVLEGKAHRLSFHNRMRAADGREWPFAAGDLFLPWRRAVSWPLV
ncbi:hypothetical protein FB548_3253 [Pseudoxanthomonas sp. 3HH-4]|uniref:hypothetical protein n=1 Tax=Pseudoxanthomonas sp. 3HH-4 TaxID=1690214 RepID=UPI00116B676F|nr:hypothetical protein [Pseudoxanthomonas sp. 3HH-4]TQM06878.1 hypothetical protein FB548_3253 [Pseudoxanthomonas sp. 3HH-4]